MKTFNVSELKSTVMESMTTRANILTLLEGVDPPKPYEIGLWKGYNIVLPDGIELVTKYGVKIAGEGIKVKVYNENGQYSVKAPSPNGEYDVELAYILTECDKRITAFAIFD